MPKHMSLQDLVRRENFRHILVLATMMAVAGGFFLQLLRGDFALALRYWF